MTPGMDPGGQSSLRIVTHKARLEDKRPSDVRVNNDALHGMVIKQLLDPLLASALRLDGMFTIERPFMRYARFGRARLDRAFSPEFQASLDRSDTNHEIVPIDVNNLRRMLKTVTHKVQWLKTKAMPATMAISSSPMLEVVYHTPGPDKKAHPRSQVSRVSVSISRSHLLIFRRLWLDRTSLVKTSTLSTNPSMKLTSDTSSTTGRVSTSRKAYSPKMLAIDVVTANTKMHASGGEL